MNKNFSLADILSITTGKILSKNGMDGIYDILNHMTDSSLSTMEIPKAADKAIPILNQLFPQFSQQSLQQDIDKLSQKINSSSNNEERKKIIENWISFLEEKHGSSFSVPQIQDVVSVKNNVSSMIQQLRNPNVKYDKKPQIS